MKLGDWFGLIVILIALYILWEIRFLLLLVFAAVVLAVALDGAVNFLRRWKISQGVAIAITMLTLLGLITTLISLLVPPFSKEFEELVKLLPKGFQALARWSEDLQMRLFGEEILDIAANGDFLRQLQALLRPVLGQWVNFFFDTIGGALSVILILVLAVMFLADPGTYRRGFIRLFPSFYRNRVDTILRRCEVSLRSWMVGALTAMSVVGILSFTGLSILRVRLAFAHALIAGLFNLIPNIGPTVSLIPPTVVAALDAPWKAIAVVILYFLIQQTDAYLVTPYVMSQQLALPPALTLIAQIFFTTFLGLPGLILALPLLVVCRVWIEEALIKDVLDPWQQRRC
ncbi:MAG: AI-2E family transporter [Gloeomargarita sp. SKYBB_i_bin120]|nr:AI-2E family transporter [Gloeomargarita sp. SKYB120]MDW8178333.1 AI-2E family transporter [Gloeomargarita sp. SKYBB_i_bin120]